MPDDRAPEGGWLVTVYYTAVENVHHGARTRVTGCRVIDCEHGDSDLGRYPADFVDAVRTEGTGRLTSRRGYLNWSHDKGFWLDSAPRGADGGALVPFRTAAGDGLARGTSVRVAGCGRGAESAVCARLSGPTWVIADEFTPGLGGARHLDLYIGEETGPDFTEDPLYTTLHDAVVRVL
ncbi:hypothetical protein [Herbihabitans rhizosphaerae]|uniref:hypothetical protein n=1 Tax=Herbihabitans rhizosphaerae TaxID=1872711 RepID=UPI001F5E5975|nr:hypothetical protein [Herbihabitans rhizosphaerae]